MIPQVRSVEPMKDIRREIERRSGEAPASGASRADGRHASRDLACLGTASSLRRRRAVGLAPRTRQLLADYVELTKPKVQSLLLLTTIATMYVAGDPSPLLVFYTCLGGYLSAGGAGAVNHWFDRDIDARMARTADRPVPSGRVAPRRRAIFGCTARRALAARALADRSIRSPPRCRSPASSATCSSTRSG